MEKIIVGKCLVRKTKLKNGQGAMIITGVFVPTNFDISEIADGDEMWVTNLLIPSGGIKFTSPRDFACSPEDFLEGMLQSPDDWNVKSTLDQRSELQKIFSIITGLFDSESIP